MTLFLMFFTTFFIQLIVATEMNIIAPLAPFLSQYFNIKDSSVIMFNVGFSLVGVLVPILGVFADKYGKKKSLMVALIFYIVGTLISGFATIPLLFALGRIFIGIGYFSLSGTNLSYLSEFVPYESRGKASGLLRTAFGIAILFSPLYATKMINKFGVLKSVYLPLTIIGVICLLLLFRLPETKSSKNVKVDINELLILLKNPLNSKSLIVIFLVLAAPSLLLSFLGIYISNNFNFNQVEIGYVYTVVALGTILGIVFAALFTDKIGKEKLSRIFFSIMLFALIPIAFLNSAGIIIGFLTIVTIGLDGGFTAYQTLCSEIIPEKRGTFMSLFYTVNAITVTIYSLLGPFLYDIGGYKLLVLIAIINTSIALKILYSMSIEKTIIQRNNPSRL
ncbi:MFS transporter [Schnuerera sp.]|uniref:MFS transporter n=1 Tax=Schnuerera sp. TaxID=2794844 RepID=UPI002CD24526|nr:MFS transporter [Schnuerera sp.]HSH36755.1 MFS transporter [Schnuerera sp.]